MSKSDESPSITAESEHEVSIFQRVSKHLEFLRYTGDEYEVHTNTKLASALDKLAGSPFATMSSVESWAIDYPILIKGEKAGTWKNPDVALFQKHATPSPFGRGEETVMDPSYRRGTELKADDISFSSSFTKYLEDELAPVMFIGKKLKITLYKLAIYEEGGHFDWHRDSTHNDAHHGTVLFALNTEWEGGELMLRHGGVETSVDMHPAPIQKNEDELKLKPVVVAFYTDMEHKVTPVTKGVRLVLQYDIEVVGEEPPARKYGKETPLEDAASRRGRLEYKFTTYPNLDKTSIQGVIDEIRQLHDQGTNIVAFSLTHLYRLASVKKEYLKGTDSALFDALNNHFDVSINPVVINLIDRGEQLGGQDCVAYIYKAAPKNDSGSDPNPYATGFYHRKEGKRTSFHLPRASAIQEISVKPFLEYIGNECQIGETRYYGAGMFVKQKKQKE